LAGLDALDDFRADSFAFDAFDEITRDLEIDIGFEECEPHLAQGVADVILGNFAQTAEVAESVLELAA
jgi:hypothetical protein